jgi:hypothetical protein
MSMLRFGHAALVTPIVDPFKWVDKKVPANRVKVARTVIAKYDPSKWLLSHATIMASVDVEFADPKDKKSNYLIKPQYSIFVNNNGDSWERELLRATYKTFLGADNYVEHIQIPELSKGKIIDVALREVPIGKDVDGKDLTTLYVDILIATSKTHVDLIEKIKDGTYNATSMGCLIAYSQCTQCGNIAEDEPKLCKHVRYFKNNFFIDKSGVKRIIAELCGRAEDSGSCKFIDGSWVRKPAFGGALLRNLVEPTEDISEKLNKAMAVPSFQAQPGMLLRAASMSAAALVNEIEAQDEPKAETKAPAEPKEPAGDDTDFPAAPEGDAPLKLDEPAPEGEAPAEAPAPEAPAAEAPAPGGAPGAEAPAPEPQPQEPAEDATVKEVEELFTKNILNKIRRKLLKDEAKQKTPPNEKPIGTESTNDNLIKQSSVINADLALPGLIRNEILKLAKSTGNEKLINGLMILSNLKNWDNFKKYGYTKKDVLGLLYFIDKNASEEPVGNDAVLALSKIKTANCTPQSFFTEIIIETGRQPSVKEARKLLKWAKILEKY